MRRARIVGRLLWVRLVVLDDAVLQCTQRMRTAWREGVSLEPSQPPWSRGSGRVLTWDDEGADVPLV